MSEEKKDFVVKDRRIFAEGAEENDHKEAPEETADEDTTVEEEKRADHAADEGAQDYQLPEINFPTFIFSLNSSALVHLGVVEDPATNQKVKNLPVAKQTIDILGMLEEKTKGNLTEDEASMLKTMLYELRMLYVKEQG
jgi:hypothetical protein